MKHASARSRRCVIGWTGMLAVAWATLAAGPLTTVVRGHHNPNHGGGGNGGGGNGGGGDGSNDRVAWCAAIALPDGSDGVFGDGSGTPYCDSDNAVLAAIGPDGGFRVATTGPKVKKSKNARTLTVQCDADGDGTSEMYNSGPFDMRSVTEWVCDENTGECNDTAVDINLHNLNVGESAWVGVVFFVDDIELGTSNDRIIYYGSFGNAEPTGGPLKITKTAENEWLLQSVPGISVGRIVELVLTNGQTEWQDLCESNELSVSATLTAE